MPYTVNSAAPCGVINAKGAPRVGVVLTDAVRRWPRRRILLWGGIGVVVLAALVGGLSYLQVRAIRSSLEAATAEVTSAAP